MRETKFRAWDVDSKEMTVPNEVFEVMVSMKNNVYAMVAGRVETAGKIKRENTVIMQYTGLKDKNGVEIYEGDILYVEQIGVIDSYIPHKKNVAVRYEERDTAFVFDEEIGFVIGLYSMPRELEVIGNIYENRELLERDSDER